MAACVFASYAASSTCSTRLSIRDIVLIERLDIDFASGLSVLTGETGAGKSILLDAFALALGGRGDAAPRAAGRRAGAGDGGVRRRREASGASRCSPTNGIGAEDGLILRRVQLADGRTRAFVNDQPVSVQVLRSARRRAGRDPRPARRPRAGRHAAHRRLLDAYAGLDEDAADVAAVDRAAHRRGGRRERTARASSKRGARRIPAPRGRGTRASCAPETGRGNGARRQAHRDDAGREGRARICARRMTRSPGDNSPVSAFSAAVRAARAPRGAGAGPDRTGRQGARCRAERAWRKRAVISNAALARRRTTIRAELERIEERLFALRAAGRKYNVPVDNLAALNAKHGGGSCGRSTPAKQNLDALERPRARGRGGLPLQAAKALPASAQEGRCGETRQGRDGRTASRSSSNARSSSPTSGGSPSRARTASTASSSGSRPIRARGPVR